MTSSALAVPVKSDREHPLIGLGSSTIHPGTTNDAFEIASDLGYDGVELMVGIDPLSTDVDYVERLRDYYQMPVLSVHAPCLVITPNVWGSDGWEKLRRSTQAATQLGADVVVVHPPFLWQRSYASNFVAGVREVSEESGITIAVENMYPWRAPGHDVDAYLPHWDPTSMDYDALTLDLSHAATSRRRAIDYARSWGTRLAHVHLTDGSGETLKDEHLFPGEGNQNAWDVVDYLAQSNYRGHIIHELNTRKMRSSERRERLAAVLAETRQHLAAASAPLAGQS